MKLKNFYSVLLLAVAVVFAVTSCKPDPNEPDPNKDPYEVVESPEGEVALYGNCYKSASPAEAYLGLEGEFTCGAASKLNGKSLQKAGANILGVRFYVANEVSNASIFVGTNLKNPTYTKSFTYKAGGWQYVLFDEPIAVTGEDMYIGYFITGSGHIMGFEEASRSTSSEYLYFNGSWSGTASAVGAKLYWSMQAIVNNRDYSKETQNDIVVEAVKVSNYSISGGDVAVTCEVRNNGIKVAKGITVNCELGGVSTEVTVSDSLMNGQSAMVTFPGVISPATAGLNNVNVSATTAVMDENISNNKESVTHFVYAEDLDRNAIVVEQFTGADCGYCPNGSSVMSKAIAGLSDPSKVAWIANHAGFKADKLTLQESDTIATTLGVSGAPNCVINRVDVGYGLVWHPAYASTELLQSLVETPAAATLDLTTQFDETTRELIVNVSGRSTITEGDNYITVVVTQNGIIMNQVDYSSGAAEIISDYSHNNAVRMFLTDAKGDLLTLDGGNYSATFTDTIPADVNGFECIPEDMEVVVYVHGDITSPASCLVYNADYRPLVGAHDVMSVYTNNFNMVAPTSKFLIKSTNSNMNMCR